jgi:hypothetical protein
MTKPLQINDQVRVLENEATIRQRLAGRTGRVVGTHHVGAAIDAPGSTSCDVQLDSPSGIVMRVMNIPSDFLERVNVQRVQLINGGIFEQTFDPLCDWAQETHSQFVAAGADRRHAAFELGVTMALAAGLKLGQAAGFKDPRTPLGIMYDALRQIQHASGQDLGLDRIDWDKLMPTEVQS